MAVDPTVTAGALNVITYPGTTSAQNITIGGVAPVYGAGPNANGVLVAFPTDEQLTINGSIAASGALNLIAATSGGFSVSSIIWPNNTTAVVVKGSAGQLYGVHIETISTSTPAFLKVYDATSATAGSGTPKLRSMCSAPAVGGSGPQGFMTDTGVQFNTGITIILTGGITDADTTAVTANQYIVNVFYK